MSVIRRCALLLVPMLAVGGTVAVAAPASAAPPSMISVDYPTSLGDGAQPSAFTSTLTNNTPDTCNFTYTVTIRATSGDFDAQDIILDDGDGNTLTGHYGEPVLTVTTNGTGDIASGASRRTNWHIGYGGPSMTDDPQAAPALTISLSAACLSQTTPAVTQSVPVQRPRLSLAVPTSITKGRRTAVTATFTNTTSHTYDSLELRLDGCLSPVAAATGCNRANNLIYAAFTRYDTQAGTFRPLLCDHGVDRYFSCLASLAGVRVAPGGRYLLQLTVTVPATSADTHLLLQPHLTRDSADSGFGFFASASGEAKVVAASAPPTAPAPVAPVTPVQGRTAPTLPTTGAPRLPVTVSTGLALLVLGVLLIGLSRVSRRGRR